MSRNFYKAITDITSIMPLLKAGLVILIPLRLDKEELLPTFSDFQQNIEIVHTEFYPMVMDFRVFDRMFSIEYSRADMRDFGLSRLDYIGLRWYREFLLPEFEIIQTSLLLSEALKGCTWVTSDWNWKLAQYLVGKLCSASKVHEFIRTTLLPDFSNVSAEELISLRENEEAFLGLRRELGIVGRLISSSPTDEDFGTEAHQIFRDVFETGITQIEKATKRSGFLRNLPVVAASTGLSYLSGMLSAGPIGSAVLSALSSLLGFGDALEQLIVPEKKVKSQPAYILWKLRQYANQ